MPVTVVVVAVVVVAVVVVAVVVVAVVVVVVVVGLAAINSVDVKASVFFIPILYTTFAQRWQGKDLIFFLLGEAMSCIYFGTQTADLWCGKQQLCQLRHNHGPDDICQKTLLKTCLGGGEGREANLGSLLLLQRLRPLSCCVTYGNNLGQLERS